MSKVLITGDIHLHDYRNHNLFDDSTFRLKQFEKLADRFVDISINEGAEALLIAGDFLHVANPRPYVVNAAFRFLDKITEHMEVYITHGQHDYDSRTRMEGEHTLLTLCDRLPNVHYVHKDRRKIGGSTFYFLGWEPSWSDFIRDMPPCNVLIGHAQPGDVKIGQQGLYMYGGEKLPELTERPFHKAFLGDIHYYQNRENWVIPGVPIQHSFNDHPDVGIISLDTDTLEWERIPTITPEWKFLQLLITDEQSDDPYIVARPRTRTEIARFQEKFDKSLNTSEVINQSIENAGLEDIHTEILGSISKDIRTEIDLNFSIESIKIENFRTIEKFEWENINEGVKLISGRNGTGKSSLVNAIVFALTGKSTQGPPRSLLQKRKKNMFVEVTFLYGRLRHTIRRGWSTSGKTQYFINDEEVLSENQKALAKKMEESLPFLSFSDLFCHEQGRSGFLDSYNYTARVDLVSRVLGLKIINELQDAALKKTLIVEKEIASLREKIVSTTSIIDQERLVDFSFMENADESIEEDLRKHKKAVRKLLDTEKEKYQKSVSKKAVLARDMERATSSISENGTRRQTIEEQTCYTCGQGIDGEKRQSLLEEIDKEISELEERLISQRAEHDALYVDRDIVDNLEDKYEHVSSKLLEAITLNKQKQNLIGLKKSIDNAREQGIILNVQLEEVRSKKKRLDEYRQLMDANGPILRSLLTTVSELLTSDTIRVRAHKQLVNGELRPDFGVDMKVPGQGWIGYDELSSGQKTVSDLVILEKLIRLVGGVGLLVFDETFKFLDNENLEVVVDLIKSLHCQNTFIVSHAEGFPYWDLSIETKVDNSGYTLYTLR